MREHECNKYCSATIHCSAVSTGPADLETAREQLRAGLWRHRFVSVVSVEPMPEDEDLAPIPLPALLEPERPQSVPTNDGRSWLVWWQA